MEHQNGPASQPLPWQGSSLLLRYWCIEITLVKTHFSSEFPSFTKKTIYEFLLDFYALLQGLIINPYCSKRTITLTLTKTCFFTQLLLCFFRMMFAKKRETKTFRKTVFITFWMFFPCTSHYHSFLL